MRPNFRYKKIVLPLPEVRMGGNYTRGVKEATAGVVQGKKASDLVVRFTNSLNKLEKQYLFRERITSLSQGKKKLSKALTNLPGELEIDVLLLGPKVTPILIDGFVGHFRVAWQKEIDEEKEFLINEFGKNLGWAEAIRIPFTDLQTQEQSDRLARSIAR